MSSAMGLRLFSLFAAGGAVVAQLIPLDPSPTPTVSISCAAISPVAELLRINEEGLRFCSSILSIGTVVDPIYSTVTSELLLSQGIATVLQTSVLQVVGSAIATTITVAPTTTTTTTFTSTSITTSCNNARPPQRRKLPRAAVAENQDVSKDARCGREGKGKTCLGTQWGNCCSQYSYCGSTKDYCGKGCQAGFGDCKDHPAMPSPKSSSMTPASRSSSSAAPSSTQKVSTNARCGTGGKGQTCLGSRWGNCCSQYSYCGSSADYCRTGCQKGFGKCGYPLYSSSSVPASRLSSSRATSASLSTPLPSSAAASSSTLSRGSSSSTVASSSVPSSSAASSRAASGTVASSSVILSSAASSSVGSSSLPSSSAQSSSSLSPSSSAIPSSSVASSTPIITPTPSLSSVSVEPAPSCSTAPAAVVYFACDVVSAACKCLSLTSSTVRPTSVVTSTSTVTTFSATITITVANILTIAGPLTTVTETPTVTRTESAVAVSPTCPCRGSTPNRCPNFPICISIKEDYNNCGACGNRCSGRQICQNYQCNGAP